VNIALKHKLLKKSDVLNIENGLTNTSLIVGIGGKDSFDPTLTYSNIQLYFMLIPFLPKKLNNLIIKKEWYLAKIKPPLILNMFLKFLIALVNKRVGVYFGIARSILFFTKYSLLLKLNYRIQNKNEII
jgi:hypothetical protein